MHASIRALLDVDGSHDPEHAIRVRARALVAAVRDLGGWDGPPFSVEDLASFCGLDVRLSHDLADDQDACVTPGLVLVNARKPLVRRRYSVAHEIGHTLFPDYHDALSKAGRLWRRADDESQFERLCQAAASEILMPADAFRAALERRGLSVVGLIDAATEFEASTEAAARRIAEVADSPVAAILLRPLGESGAWLDVRGATGHSPFSPIGVSFACASTRCGAAAFAIRSRPPRGSAADRAWKRAAQARGRIVIQRTAAESWECAGVTGTWSGEALTLPKTWAAPHQVLCLLHRVD